MRLPKFAIAILLLAVILGCGPSISDQFRRDASYAFELIQSASTGSTVLKTDMEKAMAQAKADARSDDEQKAVLTLDEYLMAFRYGEETPVDRRWVAVCRWETAQWLDRKVWIEGQPKVGDCAKLSDLHTQHLTNAMKCKDNDAELNQLQAQLKAVPEDKPSQWLKVNQLVEDRTKIVEKKCEEDALAADPKNLP